MTDPSSTPETTLRELIEKLPSYMPVPREKSRSGMRLHSCGEWIRRADVLHVLAERPAETTLERVRQLVAELRQQFDESVWVSEIGEHLEAIERDLAHPPTRTGIDREVLRCLDCGLAYADFPLDVNLPRAQWLAIHPDEHGVLCARCLVSRASKVPGCTVVHAVLEVAPTRTGMADPTVEAVFNDHSVALELLREAVRHERTCQCGICWHCRVRTCSRAHREGEVMKCPTCELMAAELATVKAERDTAQKKAQVMHDMHDALDVPWGDDPYFRINQLKQAEAELATVKAERDERMREVEHWVQRYNELEKWRAQTSRLHLESEAKHIALTTRLQQLAEEWERWGDEKPRDWAILKRECAEQLRQALEGKG
jgi:hypothetical protein